jgi:hypothetical protein
MIVGMEGLGGPRNLDKYLLRKIVMKTGLHEIKGVVLEVQLARICVGK